MSKVKVVKLTEEEIDILQEATQYLEYKFSSLYEKLEAMKDAGGDEE